MENRLQVGKGRSREVNYHHLGDETTLDQTGSRKCKREVVGFWMYVMRGPTGFAHGLAMGREKGEESRMTLRLLIRALEKLGGRKIPRRIMGSIFL